MSVSVKSFGKLALAALGASTVLAGVSGAMAIDVDPTQPAAVEPLTDEQAAASRTLFSQYGCGSCHAFADANGYGHIGPSLDGNATLSVDYVKTIVSNGQGAMPSFGGMVSDEEIETLARYIVEKKAD